MKFTCDSCGAAYMISDDKVGPAGVKVRCKKCGNVVTVRRAEEPPVVAPAPEPAAPAGLDDELGNAFDHAFGTGAPPAPAASEGAAPGPTAAPAASSEPPATEWYVAIGEAQVGPLPLAEVKKKWEAGDVGPDSLTWRPGMPDWQPLSTVADLAAYLAPVPQPAKPSALAPAAVVAAPPSAAGRAPSQPSMPASPIGPAASAAMPAAAAPAPAAAAGADEVSWKPAGASALAALASEELSTRQAPAASAAPRPAPSQSLIDQLPDSGGVDPTGAIPLAIKGMERTDERPIRRSSVARGAEQARHQRSVRTGVTIGIATALVVGGGAGAAWWFLGRPETRPAPPVAQAPAPAPAPAPVPSPPPAAAPAPVEPSRPDAAAPAGAVATADPAKPELVAAEPAKAEPAKPAPAPAKAEPVAAKKAPAPPPAAKAAPAKPPPAKPQVAKAEPAGAAPAPPPEKPAAKKKDSLLDFDSGEDDLTAALGGASNRTVYVPPKPGGTAAPDRLSDAQITESVKLHVDALRRCASEQQAREPGAKGTLKMAWTIQADGAPRDVRCLTPELAQGQFAQCIGGVVKGIRFPRIADAKGQPVTFPFGY